MFTPQPILIKTDSSEDPSVSMATYMGSGNMSIGDSVSFTVGEEGETVDGVPDQDTVGTSGECPD